MPGSLRSSRRPSPVLLIQAHGTRSVVPTTYEQARQLQSYCPSRGKGVGDEVPLTRDEDFCFCLFIGVCSVLLLCFVDVVGILWVRILSPPTCCDI